MEWFLISLSLPPMKKLSFTRPLQTDDFYWKMRRIQSKQNNHGTLWIWSRLYRFRLHTLQISLKREWGKMKHTKRKYARCARVFMTNATNEKKKKKKWNLVWFSKPFSKKERKKKPVGVWLHFIIQRGKFVIDRPYNFHRSKCHSQLTNSHDLLFDFYLSLFSPLEQFHALLFDAILSIYVEMQCS